MSSDTLLLAAVALTGVITAYASWKSYSLQAQAKVRIGEPGGLTGNTTGRGHYVPWGTPTVPVYAQNAFDIQGWCMCSWSESQEWHKVIDLPGLVQTRSGLTIQLPEISQGWAEKEARKDCPDMQFELELTFSDPNSHECTVKRNGLWVDQRDKGHWEMGKQTAVRRRKSR